MSLEFISFLATDKVKLPGLLYRPQQKTKRAAVWLHGMGDNGLFYNPERINALGEALTEGGIAFLAFNNRGAHNSKSLRIIDDTLAEEDQRYRGGTHYELIEDSVKDIDGAATYLLEHGFSELYLLGHSTGANKICVFHTQAKHNPFSKYVLAGPGDDSGLFFNDLGEHRFRDALKYAKQKIAAQKPMSRMPKYTGMYPFSAQSAFDILNPDGAYNTFPFFETTTQRVGKKPLFEEFSKINIPTLIIFGDNDEYAYTAGGTVKALELFRTYTNPKAAALFSYQLVDGADHGFHDEFEQFARQLTDWLSFTS